MRRRLLLSSPLLLALVTGLIAGAEQPGRNGDQADNLRQSDSQRSSTGATQAAPGGAPAESPRVVERNPRVVFITMKGCAKCEKELARLRRPGGDFAAMKSRGWKIGEGPENHLQIVERSAVAELVAELEVREYPTIACISEGEIVRSFKDGCTTPLDAWTFGWLLKGTNERPKAPVLEPARVDTTGSYPLRGNHWSVDGDWSPTRTTVISHLQGPNHASQLASHWSIDDWSYEELRSLHDDLHERELGTSGSGGSYANYSESAGSSPRGFGASGKMLGR